MIGEIFATTRFGNRSQEERLGGSGDPDGMNRGSMGHLPAGNNTSKKAANPA
jgi:hypothetical protein